MYYVTIYNYIFKQFDGTIMFVPYFLQSGHVWGNMFVKSPTPVSPTTWGWVQSSPDAPPTPHYVSTSVISPDLPHLVSCKCKLHCKAPCKCCVNTQPCMSLCRCQGICTYTTSLRERQDGSDEDWSQMSAVSLVKPKLNHVNNFLNNCPIKVLIKLEFSVLCSEILLSTPK